MPEGISGNTENSGIMCTSITILLDHGNFLLKKESKQTVFKESCNNHFRNISTCRNHKQNLVQDLTAR